MSKFEVALNWLLLEVNAHCFNLWRVPKFDRIVVPIYDFLAMIGHSLCVGGV